MNIELLDKLKRAGETLGTAIYRLKPAKVFCLLSGGNDSLAVTDFASAHPAFAGVIHINTGIGVEESREFVRQVCRARDWPLYEYKATENTKADGTPDPQIYEDIVMEHGFPGEPQHGTMYARLKERQIRRVVRDFKGKRGGLVAFISGVRRQESRRRGRIGYIKPIHLEKKEGRAWISPFLELSKLDVLNYLNSRHIESSEVTKNIHKSGECLCGAFGSQMELAELKIYYPDVWKRINDLQVRVYDAGMPWGWGQSPPEWWTAKKSGQELLFEESDFMPLCVGCQNGGEGDDREGLVIRVLNERANKEK